MTKSSQRSTPKTLQTPPERKAERATFVAVMSLAVLAAGLIGMQFSGIRSVERTSAYLKASGEVVALEDQGRTCVVAFESVDGRRYWFRTPVMQAEVGQYEKGVSVDVRYAARNPKNAQLYAAQSASTVWGSAFVSVLGGGLLLMACLRTRVPKAVAPHAVRKLVS